MSGSPAYHLAGDLAGRAMGSCLGAELLERVLGGRAGSRWWTSPRSTCRTARSPASVWRIRRSSASRRVGSGGPVRVVVGEVNGFAYTDDLSEASLLRAANVASGVARNSAVVGGLR